MSMCLINVFTTKIKLLCIHSVDLYLRSLLRIDIFYIWTHSHKQQERGKPFPFPVSLFVGTVFNTTEKTTVTPAVSQQL